MHNDDAGREQPPHGNLAQSVMVRVMDLDMIFEDMKRPWGFFAVKLYLQLYATRHQHEPWNDTPDARALAAVSGLSLKAAREMIGDMDNREVLVSDAVACMVRR